MRPKFTPTLLSLALLFVFEVERDAGEIAQARRRTMNGADRGDVACGGWQLWQTLHCRRPVELSLIAGDYAQRRSIALGIEVADFDRGREVLAGLAKFEGAVMAHMLTKSQVVFLVQSDAVRCVEAGVLGIENRQKGALSEGQASSAHEKQ